MNEMLGKIMMLIVTAPKETYGALVDLLEKLSGQDGQEWLRRLRLFLRKQGGEEGVLRKIYTRCISGAETLTLDATDGTETIAPAGDVFTDGINGGFVRWNLDVPSQPTEEQKVSVNEMIRGGTFYNIYSDLSSSLNSLCLTQAQIINFVKKYRKYLRTEGYGTFFLFKRGEEFFVAGVYVDVYGSLGVRVYRLANGNIWYAEYQHRVVVPQLEPVAL